MVAVGVAVKVGVAVGSATATHVPWWLDNAQNSLPASQARSQHTLSTQKPELHSPAAEQSAPFGFGVAVSVAVAVRLRVNVGAGVSVGMGVSVGVSVGGTRPTAVMWITAGGPPEQVIVAVLVVTFWALQVVSSSVMAVTLGACVNGASNSTSYRTKQLPHCGKPQQSAPRSKNPLTLKPPPDVTGQVPGMLGSVIGVQYPLMTPDTVTND